LSARFDTYYRYPELTAVLQEYASTHPDLLRLEVIGRSYEGRDIWLATVTAFATGSDKDKPALWVDGNIHATELVGSMACVYLIDSLLKGYQHDAGIRHCLDSRVFYICPRVNPDGAELALADTPKLIRSGTRPYPYVDPVTAGLVSEDMDGDGRILSMRIPDASGYWKISAADPRLMVPRDPTETGGQYYRLLPEGRIEDYDGALIPLKPKREGLDLNRNFPVNWRAEQEQAGAGPYPVSEPEVEAVVDFIARHTNICSGIAFHSYSGALLRPFSDKPDDRLIPEDLWTFETIGAKGTELTGYPAVSAYHKFQYHPQQVISGALDDWLYEELGVFAWTVELWGPQRRAGIEMDHFIDWYRQHPLEDDLKLLKWNDEVLNGQGFVDWYPFEHPQLGQIELGGWNPLYSFWNPPANLLQQEIAAFPQWLVWHNLISPRLEIFDLSVKQLQAELWQINLVVHNTGWLPTYVSQQAKQKDKVRGVICEIQLPDTVTLISGQARIERGQLEGRAHKPASPFGWGGQMADPTDNRLRVEWVVRGDPATSVKVIARHDRAGHAEREIELR
jgi:murein tripeptide amidase MpaA